MLYAGALDSAGRIYSYNRYNKKANKVRCVIQKQSFNGSFFADNAIRQGNKLKLTKNVTETCQYYAFYFDIASPQTYPQLWQNLINNFGPLNRREQTYPKICPSALFFGKLLRLELLSRHDLAQQALNELIKIFEPQAIKTGTFWEHDTPKHSLCHAFGSHVIRCLFRDALGIRKIDNINKKITIRFNKSTLSNCSGIKHLGDNIISFSWFKENTNIFYKLDFPTCYKINIENKTGTEIINLGS